MSGDTKVSEKQDKIYAHLNSYLKRRGYTSEMTSDSKKLIQKFVCTKDEFLLDSLIASNIGSSNSVALNSLSADPEILLSQFNKFTDYIKNIKTNSSEVDCLLLPILLHTFIDLVGNGYRTSAINLLKEKSNLFPKKEILRALLSSDEKVLNSFITEIKKKRFKADLSEASLHELLIFLKGQENLYLLQILNRFVDITILYEDDGIESTDTSSKEEIKSTESIFDSQKSMKSMTDSLIKLSLKLETLSQPLLPSVHLTNLMKFNQGLSCCAMSFDERLVALGCEDSSIYMCHLQPHKSTSISSQGDIFQLKGHFKPISSLDFFPDSRWLISGSHDKSVRLWDVEGRKSVVMYKGHTYHVNAVTVCTIGHMFASGSYDQTVKLWSTDRIYPLRNFLGHMQSVDCIACHPNSNYLATGSSDMTLRLWNVQDGRCVRLLLGHQGRIDAVVFSPDGRYLASGGEDMIVKLWDLGSGSLVKNFVGHSDHIYSLAFNGLNMLASGSMDGNVILWNVKDEKSTADSSQPFGPVATYPTNSSCVIHLKFGSKNLLHAITKNL